MTEEEKVKAEKTAMEKVKASAKEAAELAVKQVKEDGEKALKEQKEAFDAEISALKKANKETQDHADELDLKLQKGGGKENVKSLEDVITENKDIIEKSAKQRGHDAEFEVKANAVRASVVGNPDALDLQNVGQIATRKLTLYDIFPKIPVGVASNGVVRYTDWDETTIVRAAKAIAEGGTYDQSTAKWVTKTLDIKKIGDMIPMSEELVYDAPRFAQELSLFIQTNVALVVDKGLYDGTGVGANIFGIKTLVNAFVPVASGIVDASIYDLVIKVSEAITTNGGSKYTPDFALMNISDINKMRLKKDKNNNYVMPPFVDRNGNNVGGILVIESNAVIANEMILGDRRFARIYEISGINVVTGYATGNWEADLLSLKARQRLNLLIREADKNGFLKVTSISAALTTLAT